MRVVHLVSGNLDGGAARGAYWLHRALRESGCDSTLLYSGRKTYADDSVESLADSAVSAVRGALVRRFWKLPLLLYPGRQSGDFSLGVDGVPFGKHPAYRRADVVHLHWINGLVSMGSMRRMRKPVVWTMRDMWPMTGGCHYSMGCERYVVGCGRCPQLASNRLHDLSYFVYRHKRRSLPPGLEVVGISRWISASASRSPVFQGVPVRTISNGVDTSGFFAVACDSARRRIGVPLDGKVVLVGAQNMSSAYKGFELFAASLSGLDLQRFHFLFFGEVSDEMLSHLGIRYTSLGFLSDEEMLRTAYSAADVFVAPSRGEAFGKTLVEAMACGTPVVCFDAAGPSDIVLHRVTGYKASAFEPADLAAGIDWVTNRSADEYRTLSDAAIDRAKTHFDSRVIAAEYIGLYREMLGRVG